MNKVCTKCGVEKSLELFHKDSSNCDGRECRCAACENQDRKEWRAKNPEKEKESRKRRRAQNPEKCRAKDREYARAWREKNRERTRRNMKLWNDANPERVKHNHLMASYGISLDELKRMISAQKNCCAICEKEMFPPHIDHDHKTGKVRALLCATCNRGLGHFQDTPAMLRRAIVYLERFSEQSSAEVKK